MQADTTTTTALLDRDMAGLELPLPTHWYVAVKGLVDMAAAIVLLLLLSPLILLLMLLVKITSPGPALYCQVRLGRDRQRFTLYKIRTMHHDCERFTGPKWATVNDPRVTRLGRFLRRTHLDELPQLWNVIRGEMSLVGPRPERPEFVEQLERVIPNYAARVQVRPGVTGLAQVQLPPDTDIESVRRKVVCDLYYIRTMNPVLDAQILLATATKVIGVSCQAACAVLGIPTQAQIESTPSPAGKPADSDPHCLIEPV